jgi:NADH-quinone oxidoreductase subunit D
MAEMTVFLGPQHPFGHGLWTIKATLDGEVITDADPIIGYLHRGWEKECESRLFPQIIPMASRLCYGSSLTWEHLYAKTAEELLGVEVPERAKYLRVIAIELCRIQSHLMWLAALGTDLGNLTVFLYAMRERELLLDLMVKLCGQRMTTNYPRIGGVRNDAPENYERDVLRVLKHLETKHKEQIDLNDNSSIFLSRMQDVGVVSKAEACNMGLVGPSMRASGVDFDVRRDDPYEVYDQFDYEVPVRKEGDAYARYSVRIEEMYQSAEIIRQAFKQMPEGPYRVKVPRAAPVGSHVARVEDPRGESLMWIVGDGGRTPYRLKVRSPNFVTLSLTKKLLLGYRLADLPAIMGSIDVCMGETDR